uniref:Uncharacterized protein n=1 Tax=Percolomonas cosmopolitus TaxID=63605 RepID=A0A7S1KMS7_9EUKA|mmetsp:Transcript_1369/g.4721  ORF Transcript_1369/g.4721 Transcript_1369/m.4721 type:complete len:120 (+) Transcript_1369:321-680(+)
MDTKHIGSTRQIKSRDGFQRIGELGPMGYGVLYTLLQFAASQILEHVGWSGPSLQVNTCKISSMASQCRSFLMQEINGCSNSSPSIVGLGVVHSFGEAQFSIQWEAEKQIGSGFMCKCI